MNNQECKIRPQIININSNEPFFTYRILANKCSGSCSNINYPYAKLCVSDVVKNLNIKVVNLTSKTNETKHMKWYENYENCKCRKKLVDKLGEECSEEIDGNKMIYNGALNVYEKVCNSCEIYIILFAIAF